MVGVLLLAGVLACAADAETLRASAAVRAQEFDLQGALTRLAAAMAAGCEQAGAAAVYVRAILSARAAAALGGTMESLAPVRSAVHELEAFGKGPPIQLAQLVLQAAAAAAQSERAEMAVYLEHATRLEALQLGAGEPGAPLLSAHEAAGELWLLVHQFANARAAFARADEQLGKTGRVLVGLARTSAQMNETARACTEYFAALAWWGSRAGEPPEIAEARAFLASAACAPPP